ncbi:MAG TPA: serine/threonine-protein kinase, partial [Kofleriaceae bacterium]
LLVGETLATRLTRRGRLPIGEALAIIDAVLCALAFAHERGVLHRDLKPNNVFLTSDERIKVLDFGVALELDTSPGPVTRSAGTPGYMAPEQRDGRTQDARTDVWAAALLLVECLIGRRPEEQNAAASLAEIEAPRAIREVLGRALAADPAVRPQSANELRVALTRAGGRFSTQPAKRSSLGTLAAGAIVMAGLGAGAVYLATRSKTLSKYPTPAELNGAWDTGLFGTLQLQVEPDGTAYGVYHWDDGIIVGTYQNGVLVGNWCELPSRRGPDDGGRLQITFVRGAHRIMVDGLWTYGENGTWQKDWTGSRLDSLPPIELEQRLNRRVPCP